MIKNANIQEIKKNKLDQSLMALLIYQFFKYIPFYLGAFACLYLTHYIQSELPFMAKELAESISQGLSYPLGKLFLLAIGIIIFRTSSRLLFFYPARILQKVLRVELVELLEKASPFRYKNYPKGQLFQVIGNDIEEVRALIGFALLQVANVIIALFVLIPKLASFDTTIFIALSPVLIAFILFTLIVSSNRKFYRKTQDLQGEVQNFIIETFAGKRTVKNFHAEKSFINLFGNLSKEELRNFYEAGKRVAISIPLVPTGVGLSLIWGAYIIFEKDLGATSLILFSGFVFLFLEPMMFLSWIGVIFARSLGSWSRIRELVTKLVSLSDEEKSLSESGVFSQTQDSYKLMVPFWNNKIEINLKKNCKAMFVGVTGCGKSELIIKIAEIFKTNGVKVAMCSQDPYLYNGSILENIMLGSEITEAKKELAKKLLDIFGLNFLAHNTQALFDLVVGEDGKRLSGGQIKRVALIKTLLSDNEVLIWDDPFSSVDVVLEKEIMQKLSQLDVFNTKTIILTGHRYSTVAMCQRLILIDKESGVKEELDRENLKKESLIYEHFEKQLV